MTTQQQKQLGGRTRERERERERVRGATLRNVGTLVDMESAHICIHKAAARAIP